MAATRQEAERAFDQFLTLYRPKYPKAAECLEKDRGSLLAFYDFPAEHWIHLRTTNPIESTFATVRLRTHKTRGCVSRESILAMVFMLVKSAERHWRKLYGIPASLKSSRELFSKTAYGKTPKESPPNLAPYTTFDYFSSPPDNHEEKEAVIGKLTEPCGGKLVLSSGARLDVLVYVFAVLTARLS